MVSRLMHLLIIDVLATCVALRIGSSLQPILQQMKKPAGQALRVSARPQTGSKAGPQARHQINPA